MAAAAALALMAGTANGQAAGQAESQAVYVATRTALATQTMEVGGRSVTAYTATVEAEDGKPAKGVVMLTEAGRNLAGAALDATGKAAIRLDGLSGNHALRAVYLGDPVHAGSKSEAVQVSAAAPADGFALSIAPTTVSVDAPGDASTVVATVTPGSNFSGFVELSCAGPPISPGSSTDSAMPFGVSCTFTPENLQIAAGTAGTSSFTVQTTAPSGTSAKSRSTDDGRLAMAILLPGVLALGWMGRKRKALGRAALLAAVGAFTVLGTSACNPRYLYLKHPPTYNPGTAAGAYTLTVWAQTSNGVTASEIFTTMPLTVK